MASRAAIIIVVTILIILENSQTSSYSLSKLSEIPGPEIQNLPYYSFENLSLKTISTSIKKVNGSVTILYSDVITGIKCMLVNISCPDGICNYVFDLSSSSCSPFMDINVTVLINHNRTDGVKHQVSKLNPIKIGAINNFVQLSFDKRHINCTFINQPKEIWKFCYVMYGPLTSGCTDMPYSMDANVANTNSIALKFIEGIDDTEICFLVTASTSTATVNVEGTASLRQNRGVSVIMMIIMIAFELVITSLLFICVLTSRRHRQPMQEHLESVDYDYDEKFGLLDEKLKPIHSEVSTKLKPIDQSITKFFPVEMDKDSYMDVFMARSLKDYDPKDGFGYIKLSEAELHSIKPHKRVILMDKDDESSPKYIAYSSAIQLGRNANKGWKDVYVQNKSISRLLMKGTKVLFCARSKKVIGFSKLLDSTMSSDPHFEKYKKGWSQYGFHEFTEAQHIRSYQKLIVMKKDGLLFVGPGVRYLINETGDESRAVQPPDLKNKHKEWKHVFIQSREPIKELLPSIKYLFCAIMDRVRAHHSVYEVKKKCTMENFGKSKIPGFAIELGFGYFQFAQDEYLKPHKRVIVINKEKKLYTGSGAQFLCSSGYSIDDLRGRKSSPPNLENTEWTHIFIQGHSRERVLPADTKFLYCEYWTYK